MENITIKPSYEEARANFSDRIENIPSEEFILPDFINNHINDFIMAWEPYKKSEIPQRKQDKICASVLLWKAITNVQLINENQKKGYSEATEHRLLLNFKEKKITLPIEIKKQRDNDIKTLESLSSDYEDKKDALIRFENTIEKYIPKWKEILNNYKNVATQRISLQKITHELQLWKRNSSLLREEVINKIQ